MLRFAPSPNGRLHRGHAYSALLNATLADAWGGRFLLRIEDIDLTRCRPEYEAGILADLAWLGLAWETPVRRQSEHFATYREVLEDLKGRGLVYPCFCSRGEIGARADTLAREAGAPWPRDPDGAPLYPGTCRALSPETVAERLRAGARPAWRLDCARALAAAPGPYAVIVCALDRRESLRPAEPGRWGDVVLARKDVPTSYHLAVVVDDAIQEVTHVVRGRDLEAATDLHLLLQALLRLPSPCYHHHALITDAQGTKLAKRARSESLAELRARGVAAATIRERLGFAARVIPRG